MSKIKFNSGFTLIELMIVIAIIGVLAAMGSIGYSRYIKTAKMEELEQFALELAAGQEQFRSRHNAYYPFDNIEVTWAADGDKISKLLESRTTIPPGVFVQIISWAGAGGACGFCGGAGDFSQAGFGIRVQRDFDGTVGMDLGNPAIVVTQSMRPIRLNE